MAKSRSLRPLSSGRPERPLGTSRRALASLVIDHWPLLSFLVLVVAIRAVHLQQQPSPLMGMNPRVVVDAKHWLQWGLGASVLTIPPLPVGLLAGLASATESRPMDLLFPCLLAAHALLAWGYWQWLGRALEGGMPGKSGPGSGPGTTEPGDPASQLVRWAALGIFAFLPGLNSYEGMDNLPSLLAAGFALWAIAEWDQLVGAARWSAAPITLLTMLGIAIVFCRTEYLVLLPWFCLLAGGFSWRERPGVRGRPFWWATITLCVGLMIGAALTAGIRAVDSGRASLAPKAYVCWTFLDGIPWAWQQATDDTEEERVARGIERFGHPRDYGYSVARLATGNPGTTFLKAMLNVPRWVYELGRRHVVVPVPLAALAILGAFAGLRQRSDSRRWSIIGATWLTTLPLVVVMVNAEYLMVSYAAICLAAALGWTAVARWIASRMASSWSRIVFSPWTLLPLMAVLELFLFRGGGLKSGDPPVPQSLARSIDQQFARPEQTRLYLDPYSNRLEASCRADVRNSWVFLEAWRQREGRVSDEVLFGNKTLSPAEIAAVDGRSPVGLDAVIVWADVNANGASDLGQRIDAWEAAGFELLRRERFRSATESQEFGLMMRK